MNPTRFSRHLTLLSYIALVGLILIWHGWIVPSPEALILLLLPLLFPLRGILKGNPYTHAWSSFLILLYFIHGIVEAYANPQVRMWALIEVLFSVTFYTGAVLYARLRGRELKQKPS
ncbi:MAG: DUF2069 domain-containing protein [Gammaproteobacteria bacterium]|nr:DUF2069 domain-containing protein [Gammaproteobacteria bacterium]